MSLPGHGHRSRGSVHGELLLAMLLLASCVSLPATADGWTWSGVKRAIAISDVHGAYDTMVDTLGAAGVLDDQRRWNGSETHLVITGDILDRGADSRAVMDMIMRLEAEAEAAGGRVHLLLGNHEVMNLVGDLRYVAAEEYAAFASEESDDEREHWWRVFMAEQPADTDETAARTAFGNAAPPGFFAHRRAFRANGHYGAWLLHKPLMVVIDGTAFVHGGVSPMVGDLGLQGMNERLATELREYTSDLAILVDAELISPLVSFYEHDSVLESLPEDPERSPQIAEAIASVIELNGSQIHWPSGPLWYRGNAGCNALIESDRLDVALRSLQANRVVIGHTPTLTRRVLQRLDGRVVEIDTGMLHFYYKGSGNVLVIENGELSTINEASNARLPVVDHPRRVGLRAESVSAADLQDILASGDIISSTTDESGVLTLKVAAGGHTVSAVFAKKPRSKGFLPELAAYRLDRLLGLDMIPVTVARELDGKSGTLQFLPQSTMTEAERAVVQRGASAWCPIPDQWNSMYIFDSLIFNAGRNPQSMSYSSDNWQLILTGHGDAFSTRRGRPTYLEESDMQLSDAWRRALVRLDDGYLAEHLGDVLDKRRLSALGKRRDELLQ